MKILNILALVCFAMASPAMADPAFELVFSFVDPQINESSGLAVSRRNPGIIWTHNDSGDTARTFGVDAKTGQTRLILNFSGATARDWEDIALFPGADGRCDLLLGDIGDNGSARPGCTIYRISEPDVPCTGILDLAPTDVIAYSYPDHAHDAETLLVHPSTGIIYVVSKLKDGKSTVYRVPASRKAGEQCTVTLERVAALPFDSSAVEDRLVTAGDISPDGRHVALITYRGLYEFDAPADPKRFDETWAAPRRRVDLPGVFQWESLAYEAASNSVLVGSEGTNSKVLRYRFRN